MVASVGPPATIRCELRQAWKGAAAAADSGAGVWLAGAATIMVYAESEAKDSRSLWYS